MEITKEGHIFPFYCKTSHNLEFKWVVIASLKEVG
jgi:hypothetical protein